MWCSLPDGGRLHYELSGKRGPCRVLFNGLMMSTASWEPHVEGLSAGHRLLRVDFRDQGQSSRLPAGYRAEQHVQDVVHLLDQLAIERAHLVGVSYGGQVALSMLAARPDRVASVVLASITAHASPYLQAVGRAWKLAARSRDALSFFQLCMPTVYSREFYDAHAGWIEARQRSLASVLDGAWFDAFDRLADSAEAFDYRHVLPTIEVPTTLLCGARDMLTPPDEMRRMAALIPRGRFVSLAGAGHGAVLEQPAQFSEAIVGHGRWAGRTRSRARRALAVSQHAGA